MLECATLWIGEALGPVERACFRSVRRQGHRLTLYCYRRPAGIPDAVQIEDASSILPEAAIFRHRGGSVAPFSDWFRYEMQKRGLGTWVDADMYLLRPLDDTRPYLFGEERRGLINNAVLRLPMDSPVVDELLKLFHPATKPRSSVKRWGATGPAALTAAANRLGLASHALSVTAFYPVPWQRAKWILDPQIRLEDMVSEGTVGVHLWNELVKGVKNEPAPDGSFLARLQMEGA